MPIPTSLGLHIEHYNNASNYVIVTRIFNDRCTMLDQSEGWNRGSYGSNALTAYTYELIDPSIISFNLLKLHYPELLV